MLTFRLCIFGERKKEGVHVWLRGQSTVLWVKGTACSFRQRHTASHPRSVHQIIGEQRLDHQLAMISSRHSKGLSRMMRPP